MDDRNDPVTRLGPDAAAGRRALATPASITGSGARTTPGGRACRGSASSCSSSAGSCCVQQVYPGVRVARLGPRPRDRPRVPGQVGDRSRHGLALRRARSSPRWRRPGCSTPPGIEADGLGTFSLGVAFLFIAAVRAAIRWRLGLAALVRWSARADRRGQHQQPGRRRPHRAGAPGRPGRGAAAPGRGPRHPAPVSGWEQPQRHRAIDRRRTSLVAGTSAPTPWARAS